MPSRNRWLVVAVCATAVLAFFAKRAYDQRGQSLERLAQWEQEQQQNAWLDQTVEIELAAEVPLSEWLAELARQAGVKLTLHKSDEYKQEMPEVCLPLPPQSARDALQAMALETQLRWRPHNGGLVVNLLGAREWPSGELQTHLLRASLPPQLQPELAKAVQTYVDPDSWEDVGGHGTLVEVPGQLVIVQHYDTHLRIRNFLDKLQTHLEQAAALPANGLAADDPRLQPTNLQPPFQRWTKARRALEQKISLDVVEMPLKKVQDKLSKELGITIIASYKQLSDRGIQPEDLVTLRVNNLRAAAVFDLLFAGKDVTAMPLEGAANLLLITPLSRKGSQQSLSLVAYPLADFVRGDPQRDLTQLAEVLQSVVQPSNWQAVGGWGSIERIDKSLLITQLPENHIAIERCLQALRLVRSGLQKRSPLPLQSPERTQILAKLQEPIALKYDGVQLHEVLADLQRRTGLTFHFHNSSYDAGATPDMAVTCDLPAASLARNLPLLLAKLKLRPRVHDDYLSIISRLEQTFGEEEISEVIDARPLLHTGRCTVGELRQLLMNVVEQSSWQDFGGAGAIDELQGLLVVRQSPALLAQVREVYEALENDWHQVEDDRRRGSFISREPAGDFSLMTRLYAVDDLLKPRGKLSAEDLIRQLNVPPLPARRPVRRMISALDIYCNRYLSAQLQDYQVEPLEVRLAELRKQK